VPKVFLSYRRDDSPGHAGRLYDYLVSKFGAQKTFMDVDAIRPGADFERHLRFVLDNVDVFIVVIGPHWMAPEHPEGPTRLNDPDDFVRLEIERALERKAFIVPVLVYGGAMPAPQSLPDSVRGLTKFQAFEIRDAQWTEDAKRFGTFLDTYGGTSSPESAPFTMTLDTLRLRIRDGPTNARSALIREYVEEKLALWIVFPFVLGLLLSGALTLLGTFDVEPFDSDDPMLWLQEIAGGFVVGLLFVSYRAWSHRRKRRRHTAKQKSEAGP
jgi:hypothetical protein